MVGTCNHLACNFRFPKTIIIDGQLPNYGSRAFILHARKIANIKSVAE